MPFVEMDTFEDSLDIEYVAGSLFANAFAQNIATTAVLKNEKMMQLSGLMAAKIRIMEGIK